MPAPTKGLVVLQGKIAQMLEGSLMKQHTSLTGRMGRIVSSYLVMALALLLLSACTVGAPHTAHHLVTPTTPAPTSQSTPLVLTGGPAPQNGPKSGPLETKSFPAWWGGNSAPITMIGKGLSRWPA
jgi:hypothetical protein